ncbi:MAG: hypothetical protein OMM_12351 [Candidatus Magnetoglobus multicellularis str. Araruama]|uniref:Uncharacterized protein n=1 Tax=Candidatus Magnetoglobus multicellularis str. Araruama TaxID=890399 RepID=A0A1V1NW46_9BACT|nr:MAG: hypothetical protein OMM_12351 [Candidatus Magnetoglobus multicellularis str. Araruama]
MIDDSPNAKIVTHAIEFFEHAIDHKQIQASMIRDTALCTKDLEFVQPPLSHFIDFHQGLCNWEKGYVQWGNQQFNMIPQESRYYLKYRFELARLMIQSNEIDRAVKILQDILKADHTNDTMKKKSQITLARLYFEQKKYEMADKLYAKIAKYHKDQARFLLERAWTQFHLNHPNQAMGLLIALNAPDFRHQVIPEYYLLKSFIYKQVCNYRNALANVDAFQSTYGSLLHGVKTRQPLTTHKDALPLLIHKKSIKATLGVLHQLQQEKTLAAGFFKHNFLRIRWF